MQFLTTWPMPTTANGATDPIYVGEGAPVTVFAFGVTGKNYIFVGSDPNELYGNHYYATNGSGGAPQPPGGTCCAASSDQSDAVSPIGGQASSLKRLIKVRQSVIGH